MARALYIHFTTDAIGGVSRNLKGKVEYSQEYDIATRKFKGPKRLSGFVSVNVKGMRYFLAPKNHDSIFHAASWYVVGEPSRTRASESAAARKGTGMSAWEKAALDAAVYEVLESWHTMGADVGLLAEDLFENWGLGTNARFLDNAANGRALSPQGQKLKYGSRAVRASAVKASLARLMKAKKVQRFHSGEIRRDNEVMKFRAARFA